MDGIKDYQMKALENKILYLLVYIHTIFCKKRGITLNKHMHLCYTTVI